MAQGLANGNETTVAETEDGKLLFNYRNTDSCGRRALGLSRDGGESLESRWFCEELVDPRCFGRYVQPFPLYYVLLSRFPVPDPCCQHQLPDFIAFLALIKDGFYVAGSTAEVFLLDAKERLAVMETVSSRAGLSQTPAASTSSPISSPSWRS